MGNILIYSAAVDFCIWQPLLWQHVLRLPVSRIARAQTYPAKPVRIIVGFPRSRVSRTSRPTGCRSASRLCRLFRLSSFPDHHFGQQTT
jgi:hypothetical protein